MSFATGLFSFMGGASKQFREELDTEAARKESIAAAAEDTRRWTLEQQKEQASNRLSPYDWYVTRKAEKGTAIPSTISNYRDAVRAAYETRKTEITNASDVAALQKLIDGTITAWPNDIKEE